MFKNTIFSHLAQEARLEALKTTAKCAEEMSFTRKLSEQEIDAESKHLAELVQRLEETKEEKSKQAKMYGDEIKSIKTLMSESSKIISKGQKDVRERVFKFVDYERAEVAFYDGYGNLVKLRPAQPEELQMDTFNNGDIAQLEGDNVAQLENKSEQEHITDAEIVEE